MTRHLVERPSFPFCPGCSHTTAAVALGKALEASGAEPLDAVVVTDIGCCGIVDPLLTCHTVHGLHGRAVALAMGIRFGLDDPGKRIVAVQGDGGATIGLQHMLEAARLNVDMTLLVLNNMVYGMTGGQASGLSPPAMRERRGTPDGDAPPYDLCALAHAAGSSYSARALATGDVAGRLAEALAVRGFSLVEAVGLCQAYGMSDRRDLETMSGPEVVLRNGRPPHRLERRDRPSLFDGIHRPVPIGEAPMAGDTMNIVIAGSAGEGVQVAAELLATAGLSAGLMTTKKGEYPITVGKGFSVAEVILSRAPVRYSGIEAPDVLIAVTEDGMEAVRDLVPRARTLVIDSGLPVPEGSGGACVSAPFRKTAGGKGAPLCALAFWLAASGALPVGALEAAVVPHRHAAELRKAVEASRALSRDAP